MKQNNKQKRKLDGRISGREIPEKDFDSNLDQGLKAQIRVFAADAQMKFNNISHIYKMIKRIVCCRNGGVLTVLWDKCGRQIRSFNHFKWV